jgi:hypothetical protein
MAGILDGISPNKGSFGASNFIEPAMNLGLLGVSLWQQRQAQQRLRGLQQPSAPQATRNEALSGRISEAQQQASIGSPALRRNAEASTARSTEQLRQAAAGMGGATYGAMMQQQSANADAGRRDAILQDEMLKMRRQQQLDGLLGMRTQENQFADQMQMQDYQNRFANFAQMQRGMLGDVAQSYTNILGAGQLTGNSMGDLFGQYKQYKAMNQKPTSQFVPKLGAGAQRLQMDYQQDPLNMDSLGGVRFTPQYQYAMPSMRTSMFDIETLPPRPKK